MNLKERLRATAMRLRAVLLSSNREDQILAIREFDARSIHDVAFLLQREHDLRIRLNTALDRIRDLEMGSSATAAIRPHRPKDPAEELREISRELALEQVVEEVFDADEQAWFDDIEAKETQINAQPPPWVAADAQRGRSKHA